MDELKTLLSKLSMDSIFSIATDTTDIRKIILDYALLKSGNVYQTKILLDLGANVNTVDHNGDTPLMKAKTQLLCTPISKPFTSFFLLPFKSMLQNSSLLI